MTKIDLGLADQVQQDGWVRFPFPHDEPLDQIAVDLVGGAAPSSTQSEIRPQNQAKARPFSLSGRYGVGAFEAHTDGAQELVPPRWCIMRLATGSRTRTPTLLWDFADLNLGSSLLDQLHRCMWVVHGGPQVFYTSILRETAAGTVLRFNRVVMQPVSRQSTELGDRIVSSMVLTVPVAHSWTVGEVLVFDNWRMFHGRPRVVEGDVVSRRLERVLVSDNSAR